MHRLIGISILLILQQFVFGCGDKVRELRPSVSGMQAVARISLYFDNGWHANFSEDNLNNKYGFGSLPVDYVRIPNEVISYEQVLAIINTKSYAKSTEMHEKYVVVDIESFNDNKSQRRYISYGVGFEFLRKAYEYKNTERIRQSWTDNFPAGKLPTSNQQQIEIDVK